jgi:hypothetical protein
VASAGILNAAQLQSAASTTPENFHFSTAGQPGTSASPGPTAGTHDNFVFAPSSGQVSIANFTPPADSVGPGNSVFASHDALAATIHNATGGNAIITDTAHDTITQLHVTAAQLFTHLADFHIV